MKDPVYLETFDNGPGGWVRVEGNVAPLSALPIQEGTLWSFGPWWVDYNHAPPGAGYLQLLMCLNTVGPFGEHEKEIGGINRFVEGKFPLDFRNARLTIRLKGELEPAGTDVCVLVQGTHDGLCSGWVLHSRPLRVERDYLEQEIELSNDPTLWTPLGTRIGREDMYRPAPLDAILGNVNVNFYLVLFPVKPRPLRPLAGDPHRLRAGRDYPI